MPKLNYRYSYDTIDIFQKLSDYYASSNINIQQKNEKYQKNVLF